MNTIPQLADLDHVLLTNGKIYRVLGNIRSNTYFYGYNVYSPHADGDRTYLGKRYRKNYIEDDRLPPDVLETYEVLPLSDVVLHFSPVQSAQERCSSFQNTIWFDLYENLKALFGVDSVGIFGSSMFNLHLTPEGQIRKDIDFVIEGLQNVEKLRLSLPGIRQQLGFHEISEARQIQQYLRYQRVFQNNRNTLKEIIKRRWTGLQLSEHVASTLRFREKSMVLPLELVHNTTVIQRNVVISGSIRNADMSNLFPRMFQLRSATGVYPVYILWWKFSTPAREHDQVSLCGDKILLNKQEVIRVTNFRNHWLAFEV